ncbi:DUF2510 domain-containing protein [Mycobacterium sp.]|uniref:DUF2510 domain-containing protein n=1 Tax=Mycobacterium sp. TaxID=1785 RepID=UPI003C70DFEC
MTNPEHQPVPRRSTAALVVLVVFICVAVFGFLLMAAGFIFNFPIGWSVGLLFIPIGFLGALISGIVVAVKRSTPAQQILPPVSSSTSAVPGWYPDPQSPAVLRYFDGRAWTSSTQPRQ